MSGTSGGSVGIDEAGSATIFGVSNGAGVAHSLRFVFTQIATSSGNGDEAAIRLGDMSHIATETAGTTPGSPARSQPDDGHFVTVTLTSLCGNGAVDVGPSYTEDCDDGPANGTPASCCSSTCTFKANGTACNDNDACSSGETCTSGVCGGGALQTCPLCQTCSPMGGCVIGPTLRVQAPDPAGEVDAPAEGQDAGLRRSGRLQVEQGRGDPDDGLRRPGHHRRLRALRVRLGWWSAAAVERARGRRLRHEAVLEGARHQGLRLQGLAPHTGRRRQDPPEGGTGRQGEGAVQGEGRQHPVLLAAAVARRSRRRSSPRTASAGRRRSAPRARRRTTRRSSRASPTRRVRR